MYPKSLLLSGVVSFKFLFAAYTQTESAFRFQRYNASDGVLLRGGAAQEANQSVSALLVDSRARVWVGTESGLLVLEDEKWSHRAFETGSSNLVVQGVINLLSLSNAGPSLIVEGLDGVIWMSVRGAIWRVTSGKYDLMSTNQFMPLAMQCDNTGKLWLLERERAIIYDGTNWITTLAPYLDGQLKLKSSGLTGVAIDSGNVVWIGGSTHGEPSPPLAHRDLIWSVNQGNGSRGNGPPMVPLYSFDGSSWRAFGSNDGLAVRWAVPRVNSDFKLVLETREGEYALGNGEWQRQGASVEYFGSRHWALLSDGPGRASLWFRDGGRLVAVRECADRFGETLTLNAVGYRGIRLSEDSKRRCLWFGNLKGLYKIYSESQPLSGKQ